MSNIYTEFARLYFCPGARLAQSEIESLIDMILDERGSYWVPVWYDASNADYLDLQYGSGKGASLSNLEPEELSAFEEIWVRFADEGSDGDFIYSWTPVLDSETDGRRVCRYTFDEVEIFTEQPRDTWAFSLHFPWEKTATGWRAVVAGSYSTLNQRSDMDMGSGLRLGSTKKPTPGGFPTKTTPCHWGSSLMEVQPIDMDSIFEGTGTKITRVELRHAGRIVHQASWSGRDDGPAWMRWNHRNADDWDNCVDEAFVEMRQRKA